MKKIPTKLTLRAETLRALDATRLLGAAGGGKASPTRITCSCPSVEICPSLDVPCPTR